MLYALKGPDGRVSRAVDANDTMFAWAALVGEIPSRFIDYSEGAYFAIRIENARAAGWRVVRVQLTEVE